MQLKSIYLGLSFDEIIPEVAEEGHAAERYAVSLCAEEQAHISVFMAAPIFRVPGSGLLPLSHALVDEINAKRRAHRRRPKKE